MTYIYIIYSKYTSLAARVGQGKVFLWNVYIYILCCRTEERTFDEENCSHIRVPLRVLRLYFLVSFCHNIITIRGSTLYIYDIIHRQNLYLTSLHSIILLFNRIQYNI